MSTTYNILIMDDDESAREGLASDIKRRIRGVNIKTHLAKNRKEAMDIVLAFQGRQKNSPVLKMEDYIAIAFLDQNLEHEAENDISLPDDKINPAATGLGMITFLKDESPATRILVFTAYKGTNNDEGFTAGKIGADAYLSKSNSPQDVQALMEKIQGNFRQFEIEFKLLDMEK